MAACERYCEDLYALDPLSKDVRNCAVREISKKPWFYRVWVLQELLLSRNPWVQCGLRRVAWRYFVSALKFLSITGSETSSAVDRMTNAKRDFEREQHAFVTVSHTLRPAPPRGEARKFLNLLQLQRSLGVTNPADLVYGHLGLAHQSVQDYVGVNYDVGLSEVFERVAIMFLLDDCDVWSLLQYVETASPAERKAQISSWIPNVSIRSTCL